MTGYSVNGFDRSPKLNLRAARKPATACRPHTGPGSDLLVRRAAPWDIAARDFRDERVIVRHAMQHLRRRDILGYAETAGDPLRSMRIA